MVTITYILLFLFGSPNGRKLELQDYRVLSSYCRQSGFWEL